MLYTKRLKLNLLKAFLLFLLPSICFSAGYGGADGNNRRGERISIGSDSHYALYIISGSDPGVWSKPHDMNLECPDFAKAMEKGIGATFSCPAKRAFPLGGATYRIKLSKKYMPCDVEPFNDKSPGIIYQCIRGCNKKSVPPVFTENPWECS